MNPQQQSSVSSASRAPSNPPLQAGLHPAYGSIVDTHPPVRYAVQQPGYLGHPRGVVVSHAVMPETEGVREAIPVAVVLDDVEIGERDKCAFQPPATVPGEQTGPVIRFVRAWKRIGGGSLALSLAIHGGLILLAYLIVISVKTKGDPEDFRPASGTMQGRRASVELGRKIKTKEMAAISRRQPMTRVHVPVEGGVRLPTTAPVIVDVDGITGDFGGVMGTVGMKGRDDGSGPPFGPGPGGTKGFAPLPLFMKARCSGAERMSKLRETGGVPECEAAVSKSLAWFRTRQNPDGSWGRANQCAMTGLALLCYLGRCETPDSPFYGDNVMNGILYLIEASRKNADGFITENMAGSAGAYEHGIATYALGEMYTFARLGGKSLPGMREAFEKGVALIIKTQNTDGDGRGSWDYYTRNVSEGRWTSRREDLSVTGWQYQALKAAKNTGLKIEGLQKAIDLCVRYLERKQTKDGGIGGANRDAGYNQWSLTGAGVLGLQTLGNGGRRASIHKAMKFLHAFLAAEPLDWNTNCNLYCWYYYTQAFFQTGGDEWRFYNAMFLPQILSAQNPDGSFKPGRANMPSGGAADEILRQAFCTLQLEVYYRYLKVADRENDSIFNK